MAQKRTRTCSLCRRGGHTKPSCPTVRGEKKIPGSRPVFVRVASESSASPHVVNLRMKAPSFSHIPTFKEKPALPIERVTVDLSFLVKEANKRTQTKRVPSPSFLRPTLHFPLRPVELPAKVAPSFVPEPSIQEEEPKKNMTERFKQQKSASRLRLFMAQYDWSGWSMRALAVCLLFLLPVPVVGYYKQVQSTTNHIANQTAIAFLSLQASTVAALEANISQAELDLHQALQSFSQAEAIVEKEHKIIQYVARLLPIIGTELESRQSILQAGHHLALGNTYLVRGMRVASDNKNANPIEKIQVIENHLHSALPQYEEALARLSRVRTHTLPVDYQESFENFKVLFAGFIDDMKDVSSLSESLKILFGGSDFRRYLVLFQNHHELRATGGFPGSFAVVDLQKGKIVNIEVPGGGSYDLKGQLGIYVKPPAPLLLSNSRFEFQDANWWPHFPASAQKMVEFYEQSRGSTVDGVIAINASVFEKVLSILGPVENQRHQVTLTAENALSTLQQKVEKDFDKQANTPKAIIGDTLKDVLAQIKTVDASQALLLLSALHTALEQKEIQVYMKDATVEQSLREFGWTGEILAPSSTQDYLMVVQSNLQGQKSDAKIEQAIEHQAMIDEAGNVTDTVIIRRRHNGKKGEEFYGTANVSYVRLYVPEGAELLDAGGFDYPPEEGFKVPQKWYSEDKEVMSLEREVGVHAKTGTRIFQGWQKTIFGNWMITSPGETTESYMVYRLPTPITQRTRVGNQTEKWAQKLLPSTPKESMGYYLLAQGQSGSVSKLLSSVIFPEGWQPAWVSQQDNMVLAQNGAEFRSFLAKQESFGIVMESNVAETNN